jgi:hypothetical protein
VDPELGLLASAALWLALRDPSKSIAVAHIQERTPAERWLGDVGGPRSAPHKGKYIFTFPKKYVKFKYVFIYLKLFT